MNEHAGENRAHDTLKERLSFYRLRGPRKLPFFAILDPNSIFWDFWMLELFGLQLSGATLLLEETSFQHG